MARPDIEVRILGVPELVKILRKAGSKDLVKEMRKSGRDAARTLIPYVHREVPDAGSGRLRRAVKARASATKAAIVVRGTSKKPVPYAWPVHKGHKVGRAGYVESQPYLREGVRKGYKKFIEQYIKGVNRLVAKTNKRLRTNIGGF